MSLLKAQRNDNKIVQSKDDLQIGNLSMDQFGYLKVQNIEEIKNDITTINTNINDISVDAEKIVTLLSGVLNVNLKNTSIQITNSDIAIMKNDIAIMKTYIQEIRNVIVSTYQTSTNRIRVNEGNSL